MGTSIALVLVPTNANFDVVDAVARVSDLPSEVVVNPIAISRNENRLLLVVLIVDDVLDAALALEHVAEPGPVDGIRPDRSGEGRSEAGGASALGRSVQVPGHLVAFYWVFVQFSDDDSGRFDQFANVDSKHFRRNVWTRSGQVWMVIFNHKWILDQVLIVDFKECFGNVWMRLDQVWIVNLVECFFNDR